MQNLHQNLGLQSDKKIGPDAHRSHSYIPSGQKIKSTCNKKQINLKSKRGEFITSGIGYSQNTIKVQSLHICANDYISLFFLILKYIYLNSLTHVADFKKEYVYPIDRNLRVLNRHQ